MNFIIEYITKHYGCKYTSYVTQLEIYPYFAFNGDPITKADKFNLIQARKAINLIKRSAYNQYIHNIKIQYVRPI